MVKYKVVVTPGAQTSIRRIVDRLRSTASNDVAQKVRKGINDTIKTLKSLPESHEKEHLISDEITTYRRILKWDYRIVFVVDKDKIIVSVVDVVSSRQGDESIKKKFGK